MAPRRNRFQEPLERNFFSADPRLFIFLPNPRVLGNGSMFRSDHTEKANPIPRKTPASRPDPRFSHDTEKIPCSFYLII